MSMAIEIKSLTKTGKARKGSGLYLKGCHGVAWPFVAYKLQTSEDTMTLGQFDTWVSENDKLPLTRRELEYLHALVEQEDDQEYYCNALETRIQQHIDYGTNYCFSYC